MAQHQSLNAPYGARCFLTGQKSSYGWEYLWS